MRTTELQRWQAPLRGMDLRSTSGGASPELLFNVQCSSDGTWIERPGVRRHNDQGFGGGQIPYRIMGLHAMRIDGVFSLVSVRVLPSTSVVGEQVRLLIHGEDGSEKVSINMKAKGEAATVLWYYSFLQYGRFLFFCNGYGSFWQLEWNALDGVELIALPFEKGLAPDVLSYFEGNLFPSHVTEFYGQMVLSGFFRRRECPISNPVVSDQNVVPEELLSLSRSSMFVGATDVLVSEGGLPRSFPVEDASGFFRFWQDDKVIATQGLGPTLFVFTLRGIRAIGGLGSQSPQESWVSDQVLVSNRALCSLSNGVFFVSFDGCHILRPTGQVQKVSYEMDALWNHNRWPVLTRYVATAIKDTAYPFWPNRERLGATVANNDRVRKNVYVSLPAKSADCPTMVWVWNYSEVESGGGPGRWSIWGGKDVTSLGTRWTCFASDPLSGETYIGTDNDAVWALSCRGLDIEQSDGRVFTNCGFPVVIGLGRAGRVSGAGRGSYRGVRVRRRQVWRNVEDDAASPQLYACASTEAQGIRYQDATVPDRSESQAVVPNMQRGPSKDGASNYGVFLWGSGAPWIGSGDFHDFFAQPMMLGEENRAVVLDLYGPRNDTRPHRLDISEVALVGELPEGAEVKA